MGCVSVSPHPCVKGGQPARDDGKVGKGTKQCIQVRDRTGRLINSGKYIEWHPNGIHAIEGEYEYGAKTGKWIEWDDKGKKTTEKWYEKGVETANREGKPLATAVPAPLKAPTQK